MSRSNELRVFISSTFRDLHEEREHLAKKIFPEIRALCRARGIRFTEVDLRWGLTEEDQALGRIIRTCLEEIDKCRPYFIGITGERYGYLPDIIEIYKDPDLLQHYPWIEDAVIEGASIIDMEFRYGVLDRPDASETARFFFRRQRRGQESASTDTDDAARLENLKQRVRDAGLPVEEFRDPVSLGEAVYDELMGIIERDFANAAPPTPLDQERSRHRAFAESRRHAYIPNSEYLTKLNNWLSAGEQPLVIYAESGSGKSSLVSFWCEQLRRRQPELSIIEHYVGIGAGSVDHLTIMRHIMVEIKERFSRTEDVPTPLAELERAFANWIGFARPEGEEGRSTLLIVIDGINQLTGDALNLHWLPPRMPPGVGLIVTSTVEQTLVDLRARGWQTLGMQPLNEREREAVTVRFLAEYRKALSPAQVTRLASDVKCSHPLFLRTVLEELRLAATHETLDQELNRYLDATGTEDLFQLILERMEDDYSQRVIREVMTLLWAARFGLDETDLVELTGISRLKLTTMIGGLEYHLVRKDGFLTFFHDYLRRAVEKRYLGDRSRAQTTHMRLADYFGRSALTMRTAQERIWQFAESGEERQLADFLGEIDVLQLLFKASRESEVLVHWARLRNAGHDVAETYRKSLERFESNAASLDALHGLETVGRLLERLGLWDMALEVLRRVLLVAEELGADLEIASAELALGRLLIHRGDYDEALERLTRAVVGYEALDDLTGLAAAFTNIGFVHYYHSEYDLAIPLFERALTINRELGDRNGSASNLSSLGTLYASRGEWELALEHLEQSVELSRETGDRLGIAQTTFQIGAVYSDRGDFDRALECYELRLSLCEEMGDRSGEAYALVNIGVVYQRRGESVRARDTFLRQLEISEELGEKRGVALALGNIGAVCADNGEYDLAMLNYERQLSICEELNNLKGISWAIGNIGVLHSHRGEFDQALERFEHGLRLKREMGDRTGVPNLLVNIGEVHRARAEYDRALEFLDRAEIESRDMSDRHAVMHLLDSRVRVLLDCYDQQPVPAWLAEHLSLPDHDRSPQAILRIVRQSVAEGTALAKDLSQSESLFLYRVLTARILGAEGDVKGAIESLEQLLAEATSDEHRAECCYWLWRTDRSVSMQHRHAALGLLRSLIKQTPKHEYRIRIEELTDEEAP